MKGQVVEAGFGGDGPRQVLAAALSEADQTKAVMVVAINENGETDVWASKMTKHECAMILTRTMGYALCEVNSWPTEED